MFALVFGLFRSTTGFRLTTIPICLAPHGSNDMVSDRMFALVFGHFRLATIAVIKLSLVIKAADSDPCRHKILIDSVDRTTFRTAFSRRVVELLRSQYVD